MKKDVTRATFNNSILGYEVEGNIIKLKSPEIPIELVTTKNMGKKFTETIQQNFKIKKNTGKRSYIKTDAILNFIDELKTGMKAEIESPSLHDEMQEEAKQSMAEQMILLDMISEYIKRL